jgi:hypothetical protein
MPTPLEKWSETQFSAGNSARRVYTVSGVANELEACNAVPYQKGSTHPLDSRLVAAAPRVQRVITPASLYEVAVDWSIFRLASNQPPTTTENLLALPPKERFYPGNTTTVQDIDADDMPILNSAGDRFDHGFPVEEATLFLKVWRWESTYDVRKAVAFQNKLNADNFNTRTAGMINAEHARVVTITPEAEDETAGLVYVCYEFQLYDEVPDYRIPDMGHHGYSGTAKTYGVFVNSARKRYSGPLRLNGMGAPIETQVGILVENGTASPAEPILSPTPRPQLWPQSITHGAVFLRYKKYKRMPFSGLELFR